MRGPAARPVVLAAGGTGGHFFPAEALAAVLIGRGHRVVLMTDERTGAQLGPVFSGVEHYILRGAGIAGRGFTRAAHAVVSLAAGTAQARQILSRLDTACIVGFGGYPSIPPVFGARLLRHRPAILLHEQNAIPGRATRLCLRTADLLALGFATTKAISGVKTVLTGNPVRSAIAAATKHPYRTPIDRINLLVLGGSLGARIFSDVIPEAICRLPDALRARLRIVQQCREDDVSRVAAAYRTVGVDAELGPFFTDVADKLAMSHLVISRAGASSCAELAVVGRPAILVPLPGAIDDHQTANARATPGAIVIAQRDFVAASLAALLANLLTDASALRSSAEQIAAAGRPDAAEALADAVETLIARADAPR